MKMVLPNPNHLKYSDLLVDIEKGRVKIPQFQREFVWTMQKSASLIDSILKGYPVGTFIFWNTKDRLRAVRNIGNVKLPEARDGDTVSFVLDGQQRLTSLYASLKGIKIQRDSGAEEDFEEIYVDLDAADDENFAICGHDKIDSRTNISIKNLIHGDFSLLASFPIKYHTNIAEYRRRLESYDFPIIEVKDVPIDTATEIFTRINVSGKSLSLFEIMVAKTYDEAKNFDLSKEYDNLIDALEPIDYETISDATVLQTVSLILSKECKRQAILKLQKIEFIDCWPKAVSSIKEAIEYFRNVYRIPVSQLLPYNTLIAPFAYYFFHHPQKPDALHRKYLEDFFWRCSLSGRYSSAVESKLAQDIKRIESIIEGKSPSYDWSIDASPEFILANGWFNSGRSFIKAILCIYAFQIPKSFRDNSIVNVKNYWLKRSNSKNYHHFFPKSYLRKKGDEELRINNILNITIVDDRLNKGEIGSKPPATYMKTFTKENDEIIESMNSHLIGDLAEFGITNNDFNTFLQRRSEEVSAQIKKRLIKRDIDSYGQSLKIDDYEEEPSAAS